MREIFLVAEKTPICWQILCKKEKNLCPARTFTGFQGVDVFVLWILIKDLLWIQAYQTPSWIGYGYSVCKGLGIFMNFWCTKICYFEKSTQPAVWINYCSCYNYLCIEAALLHFSVFFQSTIRVDCHSCSSHVVVGTALLHFSPHFPFSCQRWLL